MRKSRISRISMPPNNYFYWEPHCYDIPMCWSLRSLFDSLDGIDQLAEKFHTLTADIQRTASATHELMTLFPPLIATLKATKGITLTLYQTFSAMINQIEA